MYQRQAGVVAPVEKNPNRVLGGLRGQGVDHYSVLGEDGVERSVPTQKYVQGLEQKLRETEARTNALERKVRSLTNEQQSTASALQSMRRSS